MSVSVELEAKDAVLNRLADTENVAQFASFAPANEPRLRFCRVEGISPEQEFDGPQSAIQAVLQQSSEKSVNVRCFRPGETKGGAFHYGLRAIDDVWPRVCELSKSGWYVIVNETIDINDGGVSGVILGDVMEFAPGDTPRCVDKPGTCRLPRALGTDVLSCVYRFTPKLSHAAEERVEFSIHPRRRGYRRDHTIIWEKEYVGVSTPKPTLRWPNRFSKFLGDKVFGLLLADRLGFPVPFSTVIARSVAPFSFGSRTGTEETWLRTAPNIQQPGRFTTTFGWQDPFRIVESDEAEASTKEDGFQIASLISQDAVDSSFAGAAAVTDNGEIVIEGVGGTGVRFMLGKVSATELPPSVYSDVRQLVTDLCDKLGPIRLEWAHDSNRAWVLQLHIGTIPQQGDTIVSGERSRWIDFDVTQGLAALREKLPGLVGSDLGIRLVGDIGVTSHFGDLLRSFQIPSRIVRPF